MSGIVLETWRALLAPRRLVPLLVLASALVAAQVRYSPGARPLVLALGMCLTFLLVAPALYRVLAPGGGGLPRTALRLALYAALGVGVMWLVGRAWPLALGIRHTFLNSGVNLSVSTALFLVGGWGLGRDIEQEATIARERRRIATLEREAAQAQLLALRSHLDPHFLFNTLNAIAEWCRQDGETAERAVLQLASMLRTVLEGVKVPAWSLGTELQLARRLFDLHQLRDAGLFSLALHDDPALHDVPVPPMLLLPLAENAVKHGPAAGTRGAIRLAIRREGDRVRIELENPGTYRGPRPGSDGVPTVRRRLEVAYEGEARFDITGIGDRTRVSVTLPIAGPARGIAA